MHGKYLRFCSQVTFLGKGWAGRGIEIRGEPISACYRMAIICSSRKVTAGPKKLLGSSFSYRHLPFTSPDLLHAGEHIAIWRCWYLFRFEFNTWKQQAIVRYLRITYTRSNKEIYKLPYFLWQSTRNRNQHGATRGHNMRIRINSNRVSRHGSSGVRWK